MNVQLYLPGLKPSLPYPNVDGWPVLNNGHPGREGYQSGWIYRCFYPTAAAALADARLAAELASVTLYVVKMKVDPAFRKYWPEDHNWRIAEEPPFHGQSGDFYFPRPDYYVIDPGALVKEIFVPGERRRGVNAKHRG